MSAMIKLSKARASQDMPIWKAQLKNKVKTVKPIKGYAIYARKEADTSNPGEFKASTSMSTVSITLWDHIQFGYDDPPVTFFQKADSSGKFPTADFDDLQKQRECANANSYIDAAINDHILESVTEELYKDIITGESAHQTYNLLMAKLHIIPGSTEKHLQTCHDYLDRSEKLVTNMKAHSIPITDKEVYDTVATGFTIYNQEHIMKSSAIQRKETRTDMALQEFISKWPEGGRPKVNNGNGNNVVNGGRTANVTTEVGTKNTKPPYKMFPCDKCGAASCGFLQAGKECPPCPGDAEGVKGPCFGHLYPCTPLKIAKYQEKLKGMK
ncbi:hypothetical protein HDU79_003163, partial [Rhizoclosmatium sp. JEL0117]